MKIRGFLSNILVYALFIALAACTNSRTGEISEAEGLHVFDRSKPVLIMREFPALGLRMKIPRDAEVLECNVENSFRLFLKYRCHSPAAGVLSDASCDIRIEIQRVDEKYYGLMLARTRHAIAEKASPDDPKKFWEWKFRKHLTVDEYDAVNDFYSISRRDLNLPDGMYLFSEAEIYKGDGVAFHNIYRGEVRAIFESMVPIAER